MAIGGAFLEKFIHPGIRDHKKWRGVLGIAFCGARVRAHSVVVPQKVTEPAEIEKLILQVRNATNTQFFLLSIVQSRLVVFINWVGRGKS